MANAKRDNNHVETKLGVLFSDGVTLVPIALDASGLVMVNTTDTIGFTPNPIALKDENFENVLLAENSVDGTTIPVYVDATGAILIDT